MAPMLAREGKSDSGNLAFFPGRVNNVYPWVHGDPYPYPFSQRTDPSQISQSISSSRPRGVNKIRYESMKHFTCAFWARGGCKFSEEQCLYSHQHGHRPAHMPTVVTQGYPAVVNKPMPSFSADRDSSSFDESLTPKPESSTPKSESSTPKPESSTFKAESLTPKPEYLNSKRVLRIQTTGAPLLKSAPSKYPHANQSAVRAAPMPTPSDDPKETPRKTLTVKQVSDMYGYDKGVFTKAHLDTLHTKGLGIFFSSTPEDDTSSSHQDYSVAKPPLTNALGSDLTQAIDVTADLDVGPTLGQRQSPRRSRLDIQGSPEVRKLLCDRASTLSLIVYSRSQAKKLLAKKRTHIAEFGDAKEGITEAIEHVNHTISGHKKAMEQINTQLLALGYQNSSEEQAMLSSDVAECKI